MRVEIVMPKMGESIMEGTLIKWHKKKGDFVKKDEIIYEISTDKVDTEIPSPEDGVIADINVFEQETVVVGTVVAVIETNGNVSVDTTIETKVEEPTAIKTEPSSTTQVGGELIDVPMPKMGESVMEGTVIKWHKKIGDSVKRDEVIFEISTDKVDTEVPSPVDGTLSEILVKENETVSVDVTVARITSNTGIVKVGNVKDQEFTRRGGKDQEQDQEQDGQPITNHQPVLSARFASVARRVVEASPTCAERSRSITNRFYSPLVLNIARVEGIEMNELETIPGSGANGRLTKKDVLNYIQNKKEGKVVPVLQESSKVLSRLDYGERVTIIPMNNNRLRVMQHMIKSRDTSVHVTAVSEIDMSRIHNFIEKNRDEFLKKDGIKLTYMAFISYAVVKALKEFPLMNSSVEGNNIVQKNYINLGIAVAVEPNGLIVPNIKNAEEKSIRGLAKAIADLGTRSRTKKLVPDDVADGTFSITNYGVFGSLFGTPIINQPEVGILGVGAVTKKPVVVENDGVESIAIKPMMYLSLSHDHRLVDGMLGGKFLLSVKNTLENFETNIV